MTANPRNRTTGMAALAAVPVLTLVLVAAGPLRPGWAARAGTPATLIGGKSQPGSGATSPAAALTNAAFSGRVARTSGPGAGEVTITITGRTLRAPRRPVSIVLHGRPSGAGVALSDGHVQIGQPGTGSGLSGPVVELAGREVLAAVTGAAGQRQARFILTIVGTAANGTVSVLAARQE